MKNTRVVLMGTPEFSCFPFEAIIKAGYNVVGIVSQPDRPKGRKKIISPTPTKLLAQKYNIPVVQPDKIRTDFGGVLALNADIIITCAYGQIVPDEILDAPKFGCINIHASLLPKLRGGAPIHKAIIYGHDSTGITIMDMVTKMDAGDMILQKSINIDIDDTTEILFDKLKPVASNAILESLPNIIDGTCKRTPQNLDDVTYAWNISKEEELIDWNKSAKEVHDQIRGLVSWPIGYTIYDGERFKIHKAKMSDEITNRKPGTIINADGKIIVATKGGSVELITVQPFGKGAMTTVEFLNGQGRGMETDEYFG